MTKINKFIYYDLINKGVIKQLLIFSIIIIISHVLLLIFASDNIIMKLFNIGAANYDYSKKYLSGIMELEFKILSSIMLSLFVIVYILITSFYLRSIFDTNSSFLIFTKPFSRVRLIFVLLVQLCSFLLITSIVVLGGIWLSIGVIKNIWLINISSIMLNIIQYIIISFQVPIVVLLFEVIWGNLFINFFIPVVNYFLLSRFFSYYLLTQVIDGRIENMGSLLQIVIALVFVHPNIYVRNIGEKIILESSSFIYYLIGLLLIVSILIITVTIIRLKNKNL